MKNTAVHFSARRLRILMALITGVLSLSMTFDTLCAQQKKTDAKSASSTRRKKGISEEARKEHDAKVMLDKGIEYLEAKQEERGIKLITQIGQQYPDTKAAIHAELVLGDYFIGKKQFDYAIRHLKKAAGADGPEVQAEALYKTGICYYNQNQFSRAFMHLRQVVNKFPGSVFANEAYYYIGLCHFKLNRWNQAVDALERVGTSIPPEEMNSAPGKEVLAEAGQRVFVKISDEDLAILLIEDEKAKLTVELSNNNGDREVIELAPLGKEGAIFIGSLPTAPGDPKPGDNILQTKGGDLIIATYTDKHTASGEINRKRQAKISLVSTAAVGFTNGSYEEYCNGILADQDIFMRVRDLDCDISPEKDSVTVTVKSIYKREKKEDELSTGINFDDEKPEFIIRDTREYKLIESGKRTGVFVGTTKTNFFDPDTQMEEAKTSDATDGPLKVRKNDFIVMEYMDKEHILGRESVLRTFKAPLLVGKPPNVEILTSHIDDLEIKARKNLIEGKILLHLAQIFKEMGLVDYAGKRASEGLEKIDEVLKINAEAAIERSLLEDAFNAKWELLIVQDKIQEAISVCSMLIKTFPDSALVDRALMKIAQIKIQEGSEHSVLEGMNIYRGILQLPKSELKAEAQFSIARLMEERAKKDEKKKKDFDPLFKPNLGPAMAEYKKCADNYPDSPFAGKSLERVAQFYLEQRDFPRVIEMVEQIFNDYPDADFLDSMLYNWSQAAFEMERFQDALEKCERLISEYPNSKFASRAQDLRKLIHRKIGQLSGQEEAE